MASADDLLKMLDLTVARTNELLQDLSDEQLAVPYHQGINPPLWEIGHCAFFYDYFLLRHLDDQGARMPGYDDIWDSLEIHHQDRWRDGVVPDKKTTLAYYHGIIEEARAFLSSQKATPHQHYLCAYSIYHQDMHLESLIQARQTLAYPKPTFTRALSAAEKPAPAPSLGDAHVPAGRYPIGLPAAEPSMDHFCFDNEKPGFPIELESFAISKTLVSCREFQEFVDDDSYTNEKLWSFGGKHWLRETGHRHPPGWQKKDDQWQIKYFESWHALQAAHPMLHVSYWEAEAFCQWASRRLPSEYEWEAAARGPEGRLFPWGEHMDSEKVDMDAKTMAKIPVDALPGGASPFGCLQMIGSAWEWTSNPYLPYNGFSVDMYPYMSTLQFGTHKTTKGGSCATSSQLIRASYRQAYFPARCDVFTGFRTCAL